MGWDGMVWYGIVCECVHISLSRTFVNTFSQLQQQQQWTRATYTFAHATWGDKQVSGLFIAASLVNFSTSWGRSSRLTFYK